MSSHEHNSQRDNNAPRPGPAPGSEPEPEPWYVASFRADYLERYPHRSDDEADTAVAHLVPHLRLPDGARVLDVGCGAGRHVAALLACDNVGSVVGLDLSRDLLDVARQRLAHEARAGCVEFVQGDMRDLPFADDSFEAVVSFFTAFGYFDEDAENARVVREAARVLKPGGAYLLDFLNAPFAIATMRASDEERIELPDGRILLRASARAYETAARRLNKRIVESLLDGKGNVAESRTLRESVRAYTMGELSTMIEAAGLHVREVFGGYSGERWSEVSSRCIMIAAK